MICQCLCQECSLYSLTENRNQAECIKNEEREREGEGGGERERERGREGERERQTDRHRERLCFKMNLEYACIEIYI